MYREDLVNTYKNNYNSNDKTGNLKKHITVEFIKKLGKEKSDENFDKLLSLFNQNLAVELKREVVSSIGRQTNMEKIYHFINDNAFNKNYMEVIYQMYRTTLYKSNIDVFDKLREKIEVHYDNEMIYKMRDFYFYKKNRNQKKDSKISNYIYNPTLLKGDSSKTLDRIDNQVVKLIFTSPPYYNARHYSDYFSYKDYLNEMKKVLKQCNRVLEEGRFIIINVSPVITKRPGREFESIRYPIHFDFHKILEETGFSFIDEIIWIKPEATVPNRVGGFLQTKKPLSYKPNCITESLLVYRKNANFLLDENIKRCNHIPFDKNIGIDTNNCWYINPKSDKNHPAVFPEELCEKVLKYYSFPNDIVLDPFAGSGTFGRVAKKMNRIPILCEKNVDYIKLLEAENYDII
ncbi:MAG: site-specific DNA-methyltransferase [Fusobacteria bacterium]|nr:site-specific DNA-methyltransferase [Fusobacteriota bacterium]